MTVVPPEIKPPEPFVEPGIELAEIWQSANIKAKHFILAIGGIENGRILLWCNDQMNG